MLFRSPSDAIPGSDTIESIVQPASAELLAALQHYSATLAVQGGRQGGESGRDAGRRREVAGGKQMAGSVGVFQRALLRLGAHESAVLTGPREKLHLPGYFRATILPVIIICDRLRRHLSQNMMTGSI